MKIIYEEIEWITGFTLSERHKAEAIRLLQEGNWLTFFGASADPGKSAKFERSAGKFLQETFGERLETAYPNNGYMSAVFRLKEEN